MANESKINNTNDPSEIEVKTSVLAPDADAAALKPSPWGKILRISAAVLVVLAILVADFGAGYYFGSEYSDFHASADRNYAKNFGNFGVRGLHGDNNQQMHFEMPRRGNSRGLIGEIVGVAEREIVVIQRDNTEVVVELARRIVVRKNGQNVNISELNVGEKVVIVGHPEPREGVFEATLIRIVDTASGDASSDAK